MERHGPAFDLPSFAGGPGSRLTYLVVDPCAKAKVIRPRTLYRWKEKLPARKGWRASWVHGLFFLRSSNSRDQGRRTLHNGRRTGKNKTRAVREL